MPTALSMARMTYMAYNLGMGGFDRGGSSSRALSVWGGNASSSYFNTKLARQYNAAQQEFDARKKVDFDADSGETAAQTAKENGSTYGGLSYGSYGFSGKNLSRLSAYSMTGSLLNLYT